MNRLGIGSQEMTQQVIRYWVHKGYDSDEMVQLGSRKSVAFIVDIASSWPEMSNEFLMIHIRAFI